MDGTEQDLPTWIYSIRLSSFIYRSITPKRTARIEPRMSCQKTWDKKRGIPRSCCANPGIPYLVGLKPEGGKFYVCQSQL